MKQSNNYLVLFNFCKIVEGVEQSIICNLQKEKIKFIPNEMIVVINMLNNQPFHEVKEFFQDDLDIFDSYIDFLLEEKFAFFSETNSHFIEIEDYWASPEFINNAILEYDFKAYDIVNVLDQLGELLTKHIEFRLTNFDESNIEKLKEIIDHCTNSVVRSIRIYYPFHSKELSKRIMDEFNLYSIIECNIVYSNNINKTIEKNNSTTRFISQTLYEITTANIDRKYLINNIRYFYECQKFNPYYNKKVSIDRLGNIKNCIKNRAVFGNVNNDELSNIISTKDFQEFWEVTHDKIIDIKDSELRYNYIITNDLEKLDEGFYKILN